MSSDSDYFYEEEDNAEDDFYDSTHDDYDHFKEAKPEWQVDFKVLSAQTIESMLGKEITQISSILGLDTEMAIILLRYFSWNKDKTIERYMEDPEKVLVDAGIKDEFSQPKIIYVDNFECPICCVIKEKAEAFDYCGEHCYCTQCYSRYLTTKIVDEGEARNLKCPGGCKFVLNDKTVKLLVSNDVYTKYEIMHLRHFISDLANIKWCPAPNCDHAVECQLSSSTKEKLIPNVLCSCGFSFCFNCLLSDHRPVPCSILKKWIKKCSDDSETANWLSANTKECPKCQATIEKNGGCNHMTCKKCKHEFCWICLGDWKKHGTTYYECNLFNESEHSAVLDAQSRSRKQLERYLHFYTRYINHEQSIKLEHKLMEKIEKKMEEIQQTTEYSWIEVQFFKKGLTVLTECRNVLKYTYAFGYYLARNNWTLIFEENQKDLELAVECLAELLEKPLNVQELSQLKQQILDKSVYVDSRRKILVNDTAKGLFEDRWDYLPNEEGSISNV
ncbi:hypothetical protein ROZALSC1DRAFT_30287 [Rozella allomycis CSF55]|uniref:RBR-type E3 ubiquitin transferase n=1 Tax=Rozella allomycis (strain CSF55) TaxID=988480 RepID=A0A4V1IZG3_ROZAC|nr:hypothetical protein ROZALSC1DRAFT_30287 [Rozella allomycis CSF55]